MGYAMADWQTRKKPPNPAVHYVCRSFHFQYSVMRPQTQLHGAFHFQYSVMHPWTGTERPPEPNEPQT